MLGVGLARNFWNRSLGKENQILVAEGPKMDRFLGLDQLETYSRKSMDQEETNTAKICRARSPRKRDQNSFSKST